MSPATPGVAAQFLYLESDGVNCPLASRLVFLQPLPQLVQLIVLALEEKS